MLEIEQEARWHRDDEKEIVCSKASYENVS